MTCQIEIQRTINDQYLLIQLECYPAYWDSEILECDVLQAWAPDLDKEIKLTYKDIQLTPDEIDAAWGKLDETLN